MRIAMIGQKGFPARYGGIERHVAELSRELAERGHEVLVYARCWYTDQAAAEDAAPGLKIVFTPSLHTKHLDAITHTLTATLHAIRQKPDIIHYHGVGPALLAWLPRLIYPRARVIATFHCIDRYHRKWGWLARLALKLGEWAACKFPHATIAVSQTIQSYCLNEYHRATTFIPNGARLPLGLNSGLKPARQTRLVTTETKTTTPWPWNLVAGRFILMAARLVPHKGAHYLVAAWGLARQRAPELLKNYRLVIAGGSAFTARYAKRLQAAAGNDPSIVFTGWLNHEELNRLYAQAAFLVHPSENEGLPLTVLQAMAAGCPTLLSDIPEHRELVTDNRFRFVNANPNDLANKLITLLQRPDWLLAAGTHNQRLVARHYQWKAIGEETIALYQNQFLSPAQPLPAFTAA